jgi:mannose-6-phosphate isomerase-like protein (cupin superfamily)
VERPLSSPNLEGLDSFSFQPDRVEKPWGHELIWAKAEGYAGKLLFISAGRALSLQFHREKDESWYVLEGRAEIQLGEAGQAVLGTEIVGAGAAFRFRPGTVHRVRAVEDTTILEVSTAQLDDIVRLEDEYGREGTTQP